ncbi:MAG: N-acetylmuramoyl-L-alanine amidase [Myxococcota bacterium]|nr:N-acetylmuramoyl-L-alanine amidase [Myxococcota bacterium]
MREPQHRSKSIRSSCVRALGAAACCMLAGVLLVPAVAVAGPPAFRGIDVGTVFSIREQTRMLAIDQLGQEPKKAAPQEFEYIQTIVIDPGHGGENQGAIGVAEVHEKFLTMELAYQLRDTLQERYPNARIVMTRYWDRSLTLSERIHMANQIDADLFISLHYNAAVHERAIGVETYFLTTEQAIPGEAPKKSAELASSTPTAAGIGGKEVLAADAKEQGIANDAMLKMQRDMERARQHRDSGMLAEFIQQELVKGTGSRDRGVKQANFGVLRGALMPAVVVEAGFVTHPTEGKTLTRDRHQTRVVEALITAIETFDSSMAKQRDE